MHSQADSMLYAPSAVKQAYLGGGTTKKGAVKPLCVNMRPRVHVDPGDECLAALYSHGRMDVPETIAAARQLAQRERTGTFRQPYGGKPMFVLAGGSLLPASQPAACRQGLLSVPGLGSSLGVHGSQGPLGEGGEVSGPGAALPVDDHATLKHLPWVGIGSIKGQKNADFAGGIALVLSHAAHLRLDVGGPGGDASPVLRWQLFARPGTPSRSDVSDVRQAMQEGSGVEGVSDQLSRFAEVPSLRVGKGLGVVLPGLGASNGLLHDSDAVPSRGGLAGRVEHAAKQVEASEQVTMATPTGAGAGDRSALMAPRALAVAFRDMHVHWPFEDLPVGGAEPVMVGAPYLARVGSGPQERWSLVVPQSRAAVAAGLVTRPMWTCHHAAGDSSVQLVTVLA